MSRRIAPAGAAVALALTIVACRGGASSTTPTPSAAAATPGAAPTAAATEPAVPARPATLEAYPQAAASYLAASPAAVRDCLRSLYAAWQMPLIAPGSGCRSAETDADADPELIAVFSEQSGAATRFLVAVLDRSGGSYRVAYTSGVQPVQPEGTAQPIDPVVGAGDIVGDGAGALAYVTSTCDAAAVCTQRVEVVRGGPAGYASLAPPQGITMVAATRIALQDTAAGKKAIVLTGGPPGDASTGPLRPRTDTWTWDGTTYAKASSVPAPSPYLYHAVRDADALFAGGAYARAQAAYLAAVADKGLRTFYPTRNERPELEAYALFRAGLAELMAGGSKTTAGGYFTRANGYSGTLDRQIAGSFEAAYAAKGEVSVGCSAVREDIQANIGEYQRTWDFGSANPPFDANAVCPF